MKKNFLLIFTFIFIIFCSFFIIKPTKSFAAEEPYIINFAQADFIEGLTTGDIIYPDKYGAFYINTPGSQEWFFECFIPSSNNSYSLAIYKNGASVEEPSIYPQYYRISGSDAWIYCTPQTSFYSSGDVYEFKFRITTRDYYVITIYQAESAWIRDSFMGYVPPYYISDINSFSDHSIFENLKLKIITNNTDNDLKIFENLDVSKFINQKGEFSFYNSNFINNVLSAYGYTDISDLYHFEGYDAYFKAIFSFNNGYFPESAVYSSFASSGNSFEFSIFGDVIVHSLFYNYFNTPDAPKQIFIDSRFFIKSIEYTVYPNSESELEEFNFIVGKDGNYFYNVGYNAAISSFDIDAVRNSAYNEGRSIGEIIGYNRGVEESSNISFSKLFWSIASVPSSILLSLFNFEIFGFNLFAIFTGVISCLVIVWIIKRFI